MKKWVVMCSVASVLLAMSTAVFAEPVTVTLSEGDVSYDNTVKSGFEKSGSTITWFQPYKFEVKGDAPDAVAMGYPKGGELTLEYTITSATLTIVANGVSPVAGYGPNPQRDSVSRSDKKTGPWTAIVEPGPVYLKAASTFWGDSTTTIDLAGADGWLNGKDGYYTQVKVTDGSSNQNDTVKSSKLQVKAHYVYKYTFTPKKVVFVSAMHLATPDPNDPNAPSVASDQGFVDALKAAWYDVDYTAGDVAGTSYWEVLDPNKMAVLQAADLIIIGRDCNSGGVSSNADEIAFWNGLQTPVMLMSSYIAANNRWKWINSNSQDARKAYYLLRAVDVANPIFAGVTFDMNDVDPNTIVIDPNDPNSAPVIVNDIVQWYDPNAASGYASFINSNDAGNGSALALRPDNGNLLVAEWLPGLPFYATAGQIAGGHRMFFNAGTQEISGQKTNWGVMNLNDVGTKIFLNAVEYMTIPVPLPVPLVNASFEQPGTEKIKGWNGEGIAGTPAVDIPGWASDIDPNVVVADSGVETGYGATDGLWTAFLMGADPAVWQNTGFLIAAEDVFELKVDARNTWQGTTLRMTLYYLDADLRVPAATADVTVTDAMQTFALPFNAADLPACVGKEIGIEFDNVTTEGQSWIGLDNVRLTVK